MLDTTASSLETVFGGIRAIVAMVASISLMPMVRLRRGAIDPVVSCWFEYVLLVTVGGCRVPVRQLLCPAPVGRWLFRALVWRLLFTMDSGILQAATTARILKLAKHTRDVRS